MILCSLSVYVLLLICHISHCLLCSEGIHNLGFCLLDKGKLDEAENLLKESLDMKRTACPENKASIASSESLCLSICEPRFNYLVGALC